ncbi:hypothetical protein [Streptomyces sp. NRRL S-87]|uniref:hypothetical protein n=1 Tax=Streptomyces sp. NRRL S-87 TaxID=1463920 RepID=UPI0004BF7E88|nr:hypothetical protein [Streptomyces sp. NRRL S-87]
MPGWILDVLVLATLATLAAALTAGLQADPRPSLRVTLAYGGGLILVFVLLVHWRGGTQLFDRCVSGAMIAGFGLPWVIGTDVWGRWLAEAVGLL